MLQISRYCLVVACSARHVVKADGPAFGHVAKQHMKGLPDGKEQHTNHSGPSL
jgi:hypothetical protein